MSHQHNPTASHSASHAAESHHHAHGHDHGHGEHPIQGGGASHGVQIQHMQVFVYGVVGFLLIAVAVIATTLYFNWYKTNLKFEREEMANIHQSAAGTKVEVLSSLEGFAANKDAPGSVRIPIEEAKKRVINQYNPSAK